jgi:hypothetical protein
MTLPPVAKVGKLSKKQNALLLRFYKADRPDIIDEDAAERLLLKAMAAAEGEKPLRELERSLQKGVGLFTEKIASVATHYGTTTRCVNQIYGEFASPFWKSWFATHSVLNLAPHFHGGRTGHVHRSRFVWHGGGCLRQELGPESLRPKEVAVCWSRFEVVAAAGLEPAGVSTLAQLLVEMYVLSAEFQARLHGTINFIRTSYNENFNSSINQFTPMQIRASDAQGAAPSSRPTM